MDSTRLTKPNNHLHHSSPRADTALAPNNPRRHSSRSARDQRSLANERHCLVTTSDQHIRATRGLAHTRQLDMSTRVDQVRPSAPTTHARASSIRASNRPDRAQIGQESHLDRATRGLAHPRHIGSSPCVDQHGAATTTSRARTSPVRESNHVARVQTADEAQLHHWASTTHIRENVTHRVSRARAGEATEVPAVPRRVELGDELPKIRVIARSQTTVPAREELAALLNREVEELTTYIVYSSAQGELSWHDLYSPVYNSLVRLAERYTNRVQHDSRRGSTPQAGYLQPELAHDTRQRGEWPSTLGHVISAQPSRSQHEPLRDRFQGDPSRATPPAGQRQPQDGHDTRGYNKYLSANSLRIKPRATGQSSQTWQLDRTLHDPR
jgi:hypothetical protein